MEFVEADVATAFSWLKEITGDTVLSIANRFLDEIKKIKNDKELVRCNFTMRNTIMTIPSVVMDLVGHILSKRQHSAFYKFKYTVLSEDSPQDKALNSEDHRRYDVEVFATIVPAGYATEEEPTLLHGKMNKEGVYEVNATVGV